MQNICNCFFAIREASFQMRHNGTYVPQLDKIIYKVAFEYPHFFLQDFLKVRQCIMYFNLKKDLNWGKR